MKKKEQFNKIWEIIKKVTPISMQLITLFMVLVLLHDTMVISTEVDYIRDSQDIGTTLTRVVTICSPGGMEEIEPLSLTHDGWLEFFKTFSSEEVLGLKIETFEELFQTMREFSWDSSLNPFASSEIYELLEEANIQPSSAGFYTLQKSEGVWQSELHREGTDLSISPSYNSHSNILTVRFINFSTKSIVEKDFMALNPKVILSPDNNARYIIFYSINDGALYAINDIGALFRLS